MVPIPSAEKSGGIPIADRDFLKGESDYAIWCMVMKSHLGTYATATALGSSICPTTDPGKTASLAWDQFAPSCIMLSIYTDFIIYSLTLRTSVSQGMGYFTDLFSSERCSSCFSGSQKVLALTIK